MLVRAAWTSPPYVSEALVDGLSSRLGGDFTLVDFACQHMVAQANPGETAAVIREHLARR